MQRTEHQAQPDQKSKAVLLSQGILIGIMRNVVGFPIEQPLDSVKTQWQASSYHKNEFQIAKDIWNTKGLKGYYSGSIPNVSKSLLRGTYQFPLMISLPSMCEKLIPNSLGGQSPSIQKYFTALFISVFDSFILTPLERLKVYQMTKREHQSRDLNQFYRTHRNNLIRELFRGTSTTIIRQFVTWSSFFQGDLYMKKFLR